ncbi:3'(2'),5'-bisphosphate nucleotidase CysQ [Phytoactinopolyspora endophytica]|uniref:3'(2'),5'-bisphosphate nucleotidase CysQ n=1 Tax=Phytoactinopolyspora endophytica TaxID=1642495 RepID=UPI00101D61A7|nr:3'(2'),5'-bisphosphate nucleotidase CysQ [Phytoactinopolyspora endophytica]
MTDAALAARLAEEAGTLLLELRDRHGSSTQTTDQRELRRAGDRAAQEYLAKELAGARPDDAVLSEEADDDRRRLTADRVWIIDPLDGTKEYAEGRSDWAVHVALWTRDGVGPVSTTAASTDAASAVNAPLGNLVAGAVALPGRATTLSSDSVQPPEPPSPLPGSPGASRPWRIAVSRSRAPEVAERAATALGAELVPMGSAGYKVASVVLGEVDAYVHAGGQYQWDSAAPVAVAQAAGLHATRLDGSPLRYNDVDRYLPDLLVARPEVADALLAACSDAAAAVPRSHT